MYYKFNEKTLQFEETNAVIKRNKIIASLIFGFVILPITLGLTKQETEEVVITPEEKVIVIKEYNEFSEEKLIDYISDLNFRFPHIILAQSKLESNYYKSPIFLESHNMFGMKEAKIRSNLAKGTHRGHAYYDNWKESVLDYALYYSTYLYDLKSEEQYFNYLKQYYAEDPNYVPKLRSLIKKENLKEVFNNGK